MKRNRIKFFAVVGFVMLGIGMMIPGGPAMVSVQAGDTAADYKTKCAMCHGQKAEKAFDPAKSLEHHIEIILKGKKDSKPPMPGYEAKGMTAEEAKALAEHMLAIRAAQ